MENSYSLTKNHIRYMPNIKIRVNKSQPHFDLEQMRRDQYMQFKVQETVKNTCRRLAEGLQSKLRLILLRTTMSINQRL